MASSSSGSTHQQQATLDFKKIKQANDCFAKTPNEAGKFKCLACSKFYSLTNGSNASQHLRSCARFLKDHKESYQKLFPPEQKKSTQQKLPAQFKKCSDSQEELDELLITCIADCDLSFHLFSRPSMKDFIKKLNPDYALPTRQKLSTELLNSVYNKSTNYTNFITIKIWLSYNF